MRRSLFALVLLAAGCGRPAGEALAIQRRRCLALLDTLPRLEAEERAWPRAASLACDEHGEARAREVQQLRADLAEACAERSIQADLTPAFEAAAEVERCAACAPEHARHCTRARELLVDTQLALAKAGLR